MDTWEREGPGAGHIAGIQPETRDGVSCTAGVAL
jgi:hypothetical protein